MKDQPLRDITDAEVKELLYALEELKENNLETAEIREDAVTRVLEAYEAIRPKVVEK